MTKESYMPKVRTRSDVLKQKHVNYLINNDIWDTEVTPQQFKDSIISSTRKEFIADYTLEDLSKMKLFKLKPYNIGYALKKRFNHITGEYISNNYDEISSIHNNESNVSKLGNLLVKSAIRHGGNYLAYFDTTDQFLANLYYKMGFREYHRHELDPNWEGSRPIIRKHGNIDIVYCILKG